MLSPDRIQEYRTMSPARKWAEFVDLIESGWRLLQSLPPEERERRLALMRREHQAVCDDVARALV